MVSKKNERAMRLSGPVLAPFPLVLGTYLHITLPAVKLKAKDF